MKNWVNVDRRILSTLALACYGFGLTACAVATYALVRLTEYFSSAQSLPYISSQL